VRNTYVPRPAKVRGEMKLTREQAVALMELLNSPDPVKKARGEEELVAYQCAAYRRDMELEPLEDIERRSRSNWSDEAEWSVSVIVGMVYGLIAVALIVLLVAIYLF
jgi:hypothetical protein